MLQALLINLRQWRNMLSQHTTYHTIYYTQYTVHSPLTELSEKVVAVVLAGQLNGPPATLVL